MGALVSAKGPPGITARDRAVLDLKVQRDRLHKYTKQVRGGEGGRVKGTDGREECSYH